MAETQAVEPTAPTNGVRALHISDADRSAVLADLEKMGDSEAEPVEAKPAAKKLPPADDEPAEEADAEAKADDDDAEAEVEAKADEPAEEAKPDRETEKRLSAVQKAEKRSREAIAKERAEARAEIERERQTFAREVSEWKPKLEKFESLKSRAKYAAAEVLRELGLGDEDLEAAARDCYAQSSAGRADPKNRDAAARMQREREAAGKVEKLERELADMRKAQQEREQQQQVAAHWDRFFDGVTKHAADERNTDAPLARHFLSKSPAKTAQRFREITLQLLETTGEVPDADDVLVTYDKQRRAELEELGVDVDAIVKGAPAPKAETKAEAVRSKKTIGADLGSKTTPKDPVKRPSRAELLAELDTLAPDEA